MGLSHRLRLGGFGTREQADHFLGRLFAGGRVLEPARHVFVIHAQTRLNHAAFGNDAFEVGADPIAVPAPPEWAVRGTAETRRNLVTSIYLEPDVLERHVRKLEAKYQAAERAEVRAECWRTDDADIVLIGYGIMGRTLKAVVEQARKRGLKVGLLRPITLYPFP